MQHLSTNIVISLFYVTKKILSKISKHFFLYQSYSPKSLGTKSTLVGSLF